MLSSATIDTVLDALHAVLPPPGAAAPAASLGTPGATPSVMLVKVCVEAGACHVHARAAQQGPQQDMFDKTCPKLHVKVSSASPTSIPSRHASTVRYDRYHEQQQHTRAQAGKLCFTKASWGTCRVHEGGTCRFLHLSSVAESTGCCHRQCSRGRAACPPAQPPTACCGPADTPGQLMRSTRSCEVPGGLLCAGPP